MRLSVKLYSRDFSRPLLVPTLSWEVGNLDWDAIGGPDLAELKVTGSLDDLWQLVDDLRCPIELYADQGQPLWWGYISRVEMQLAQYRVGVGLDDMANAVTVAYNMLDATGDMGERGDSVWYTDTLSLEEYGRKELRVSLSNATYEQADNMARTTLARLHWPVVTYDFSGGDPGVVVTCSGWWRSLGWRYYQTGAGYEAYENTSDKQRLGELASNTKVAQSFVAHGSSPWLASSVSCYLDAVGSPQNDLVIVQLCADNGGRPGAVLAQASFTDISDQGSWISSNLPVPVQLQPETTYWLVLSTTGPVDPENYYEVGMSEQAGYLYGKMRLYNGYYWEDRYPEADMAFIVGGILDTALQVQTAIEGMAQFLPRVDLALTSGVATCQYRDGDQSLQDVVEELLASGTQHGRRMLATVDVTRRVDVIEEPAEDQVVYYIDSRSQVSDAMHLPVLPWWVRPGVWMSPVDLLPVTLEVSRLANPDRMFIEHVRFDGKDAVLTRRDEQTLTGQMSKSLKPYVTGWSKASQSRQPIFTGNKITLFPPDGSPLQQFPPNDLGLDLATAQAGVYPSVIWLPQNAKIMAEHTLGPHRYVFPAGIEVAGRITLSDGTLVEGMQLHIEADQQEMLIGVIANDWGSAYLDHCTITLKNKTGQAAAIVQYDAGNLYCRDCTFDLRSTSGLGYAGWFDWTASGNLYILDGCELLLPPNQDPFNK